MHYGDDSEGPGAVGSDSNDGLGSMVSLDAYLKVVRNCTRYREALEQIAGRRGGQPLTSVMIAERALDESA